MHKERPEKKRLKQLTENLVHACQAGTVAAATAALREGADVNQPGSDGFTPLYVACAKRKSYLAREVLLKWAGIEIDKTSKGGYTALYVACNLGLPILVEALLNAGADVNKAEKVGQIPLFTASWKGHSEVVFLLLQWLGVKVNQARHDRTTPLYMACLKGHLKVVELLLKDEDESGIDVNKARKNGMTPLMIACKTGHADVVTLLLKQKRIGVTCAASHHGGTALYYAAYCSSWPEGKKAEVIMQLITAGGPINPNKPVSAATALYAAYCANDDDAANLLVDQGANRVQHFKAAIQARGCDPFLVAEKILAEEMPPKDPSLTRKLKYRLAMQRLCMVEKIRVAEKVLEALTEKYSKTGAVTSNSLFLLYEIAKEIEGPVHTKNHILNAMGQLIDEGDSWKLFLSHIDTTLFDPYTCNILRTLMMRAPRVLCEYEQDLIHLNWVLDFKVIAECVREWARVINSAGATHTVCSSADPSYMILRSWFGMFLGSKQQIGATLLLYYNPKELDPLTKSETKRLPSESETESETESESGAEAGAEAGAGAGAETYASGAAACS